MKKFIFIILSFFIINVSAQTTQEITKAERIIDKYSEKVINTVEKTVKVLEQPAKEIFESVIRLQIARGIALLSMALTGLLLIFLPIIINKTNWSSLDKNMTSILSIIIGLTLFLIGMYYGLSYCLAPEWYGIQEIFNLFK